MTVGVWNKAHLLFHFKLCASFYNHRWIQTWVTIRKRPIRVTIGDSWSRVTLNFDGWPWKTIGHLFHATSSFAYHFIAISQFKLIGVTSRKRPIRVKLGDSWSPVNLNFDGWPWKTIGHLFYATSSFVYHLRNIGEFKLELLSGNAQFGGLFLRCDLENLRMISTGPFQYRWLKGYIYSSCFCHHQIGSIHLSHCYYIFPWLCVWDVCYFILCYLLHKHSGKPGIRFHYYCAVYDVCK